MNKKSMGRMILLACALFLMLTTCALAESLPEGELAILLNGQRVEETVLNLSEGKTLQFSATEPVTWKSSKTYRGTIDANGLFTALSTSTLNVTATTADGRKAVCEVKIKRLVTDITISGSSEVAAGKYITLKASAQPSNAAERSVKWSSSDPSVATVNSSGRVTAKSIKEVRTVVITATAADGSGVTAQHVVTVRPPVASIDITADGQKVTSVVVDINNPVIDLDAAALPADAAQSVKWSSDSSSRVKFDQNGVVTALKTGTVTMTATAQDGSGRKATVKLKIIRPVQSIQISGDTALAAGKSGDLKVKVLPSNATDDDVTWESSNPELLTVNKYGDIKSAKIDYTAQVTVYAKAKDGSGVVGSAVVTITPSAQDVVITMNGQETKKTVLDISTADTLALGAHILPADARQDVKWTSSNTKTATVNENGLVTAKRTGTVTVTATARDGSGKKETVEIKIIRAVQSITLSGDTELTGGETGRIRAKVLPTNATNDDVTWESTRPEVLTVNKYGEIKAAKVGTVEQAEIRAVAKDGSGVTAGIMVTITPAAQSVSIFANGENKSEITLDITTAPTLQLTHEILPADALQDIKWTSSNTKTAAVDENGLLTAKRTGTVTITAAARDGSGKKATLKVRIIRAVESITVTGDTTLYGGKEGKLRAKVLPSNATNDEVSWESSAPEVLTVNKYGSLKAAKVTSTQTVTVYAKAKDGSGVVGSVEVTVIPRATKVNILRDGQKVTTVGIDLAGVKTMQLSAMVEPADALQDVKWTSSSSRVTVDQNGMIKGLRSGSATITATAKDGSGVKASITVNVGYMVRSITIVGASQITGGRTVELDTTVLPTNATKKSVSWSSSDPTIARVDADGEVTAAKLEVPTQVVITATAKDGGGATAQYTMTVLPAAQSIALERTDGNMGRVLFLNNEQSSKISATVYPALANQNVTWSSSNRSVATVTADGVVTGHDSGRASIVAKAADGSGVKAVLWVGVGNLSERPYYFEVDRANQVVRVYERGEDNSYTKLIKRMICSTGKNSTPGLDNGLYSMHGGRMIWMDGVAIYATRIKDCYLFHSVIYEKHSMSALDKKAYYKLGTKASGGCIRLLAGDAKWIHDNVPKGCFVMMMEGVRDVNEYGAVTLPPLKSGKWDPTNPSPNNPDFDPTYTSDVE